MRTPRTPRQTRTRRPSRGRTAPPVSRQREIPEEIRALMGPGQRGYADLFALATDGTIATPEVWARAMLEQVAGIQGQFVWRVLLGLRLRPRPRPRLRRGASPQHIAGWRIAERREGLIRVEAHGRMLTGNLVVRTDGDQVSLATVLRYRSPAGARIWKRLSAVHRRLTPDLLRDAHRLVLARPSGKPGPGRTSLPS
ncbi:hypothetical protein ACIBCA_25275 [Kitasatospora sp. NPDC051170]|uniref:hypothetical protein n=1 Tax=Kitasatospora sp. NPDC051170 TaxID=3364056 RepID=UPI00379FF1F8